MGAAGGDAWVAVFLTTAPSAIIRAWREEEAERSAAVSLFVRLFKACEANVTPAMARKRLLQKQHEQCHSRKARAGIHRGVRRALSHASSPSCNKPSPLTP